MGERFLSKKNKIILKNHTAYILGDSELITSHTPTIGVIKIKFKSGVSEPGVSEGHKLVSKTATAATAQELIRESDKKKMKQLHKKEDIPRLITPGKMDTNSKIKYMGLSRTNKKMFLGAYEI